MVVITNVFFRENVLTNTYQIKQKDSLSLVDFYTGLNV